MKFFELYPSEQREVDAWKQYLKSVNRPRVTNPFCHPAILGMGFKEKE
jgi:hypothetical protein